MLDSTCVLGKPHIGGGVNLIQFFILCVLCDFLGEIWDSKEGEGIHPQEIPGIDTGCRGRNTKTWRECVDTDMEVLIWFASWISGIQGYVEGRSCPWQALV